MGSKKTSLAVSLLTLVSLTGAHVLLENPVPYGAATLNTNPLEKDGSDYPCKQRDGVYAVTKVNVMPIGQPQTISFKGQATHGGGSCQISLTTDTPPTKDSVFKVIKSIEGGCPSTNPGNVGIDPFGHGADKFQFSIPDSIPAGKNYTLAWTWFNKIGDREMYMNCAPITVPASSQRRSFDGSDDKILDERDANSIAALPVMFRANIGPMGNGCQTADSGTVLDIPKENLGANVQRIGNEPLTPPKGNCGGTYGAARAAAEPAAEAPAAGTASSAQPVLPANPSTTTTVALASTLSVQPAAPVVSGTTAAVQSTSTAAASSVSSGPETPASSSTAAPASPGAAAPSTPGITTGTCPTPGKSVCSSDGTSWGTCDEQHHVIFQKVPAGTKCDPELGVLVHLKRSRVFRA
ncbi:MAG: hypothetical protein Q9201_005412 [Fulgogasparrea decipioides]